MTIDLAILLPLEGDGERVRWPAGPLPVNASDTAAELELRSTYFGNVTSDLLFSTLRLGDRASLRRHMVVEAQLSSGVTLKGLELAGLAESFVLVAHLRIAEIGEALDLGPLERSSLTAPELSQLISEWTGGVMRPRVVFRRYRRIAFIDHASAQGSLVQTLNDVHDPQHSTWAWMVGAGVPAEDLFETSNRGEWVAPSSSWLGWVMRDAISFVARRSEEADSFIPVARRLCRSVYLDVLLVSEIRELELERVRSLVAACDEDAQARSINEVEFEVSQFRAKIWRPSISHHALAKQMNESLDSQRRLVSVYEHMIEDLNEVVTRVRLKSERRTASALALIATVGVPLSLMVTLVDLVATGFRAVMLALVLGTLTSIATLAVPPLRHMVREVFGG